MLSPIFVAAALGLSNFAASIGIGLCGIDVRARLRVALVFGLFEAAMPLLGLLVGHRLAESFGSSSMSVGGGLLIATGGYTVVKARRGQPMVPNPSRPAGGTRCRRRHMKTSALWLSLSGSAMSSRAVDLVIRRLATEAHLELSAHVRHIFVTNLIRSGADVVLAAELAGHRRLDTIRRYSVPSPADMDALVEAVVVET